MSEGDRWLTRQGDRELYGVIAGVAVAILLLSIVVAYALRSFTG